MLGCQSECWQVKLNKKILTLSPLCRRWCFRMISCLMPPVSRVTSQFLKLPPRSVFCQHDLYSLRYLQPYTQSSWQCIHQSMKEATKLRESSQLKNWRWTLKQAVFMCLSISCSDVSFDLETVAIACTKDSIAQKTIQKYQDVKESVSVNDMLLYPSNKNLTIMQCPDDRLN